jgi:hypothetical protein
MRRKIFAAAAVLWMIVIFSFSAKVSEDSEEMSRSVGMLIGKAVIKEYKEWQRSTILSARQPMPWSMSSSEYCLQAPSWILGNHGSASCRPAF